MESSVYSRYRFWDTVDIKDPMLLTPSFTKEKEKAGSASSEKYLKEPINKNRGVPTVGRHSIFPSGQ